MGTAKMRYALVDGEKSLPQKGLHGVCPLCGAEVISKCGISRIHHWAHANIEDCDAWSEGKTDWHIAWQERFPKAWQEYTIRHGDVVHRADVCALDENNVPRFVIEFQHSFLEIEAIREREAFYPNLVWVVDLTSKKRDCTRLLNGLGALRPIQGSNIYQVEAEKIIPANWLNCSKPVMFDCAASIMQQPVMLCLDPALPGHKQRFVKTVPIALFLKLSLELSFAEALDKAVKDLETIPDNYQEWIQKKLEAAKINAAFDALPRQQHRGYRGRWHL